MQQTDYVVSGWLDGSDSIDGHDNPAGPLYLEGQARTEAALMGPGARAAMAGRQATFVACQTFVGGTSCSYDGGCMCC